MELQLISLAPTHPLPRPHPPLRNYQEWIDEVRITLSTITKKAEGIIESRSSPYVAVARQLVATPWPTPNLLDLGGDARRTREEGGKPQCTLAAVRNLARNPQICNDTLTLFPLGRGWNGKNSSPSMSSRNATIARIPWINLIEHLIPPSIEVAWRLSCDVTSNLDNNLMSDINRAVIPENRGGGVGSHVSVIIRDKHYAVQPSWHYLDNEATAYPKARPNFATHISAGKIRGKVRQSKCG